MHYFLLLLSLAILSTGLNAAAPGEEDHPLIPRYPGSQLVGFDDRYYDQAFIPKGKDLASGQWVAGRFQWRAYRAPAGISGEKLFTYFDQVLGKAGFKAVHACIRERCGDTFFYNMLQASIRHVSEVETWVNDSAYYMAVRLQRNGLDRWVSLLIYSTPGDGRPLIRIETVDVAPPRPPAQLNGVVVGEEVLPNGAITLAAGTAGAGGITDVARLEGQVVRRTMVYEADASPSEVLASWVAFSKANGFRMDFYCGGIFCGPRFIDQVRLINRQFPQGAADVWKVNSAYYFTALKDNNGDKTAMALLSYLQADGRTASHLVEVSSRQPPPPPPQAPATGVDLFKKKVENPLKETIYRDGKIVLHNILFKLKTAEFAGTESLQAIGEVAEMLIANPSMAIYVDAHTDNQGSDESNQTLSLARAEAVVEVLVNSHGVNPERLHPRGFGESIQMVSNHTAQGRDTNRRIEIVYKDR